MIYVSLKAERKSFGLFYEHRSLNNVYVNRRRFRCRCCDPKESGYFG